MSAIDDELRAAVREAEAVHGVDPSEADAVAAGPGTMEEVAVASNVAGSRVAGGSSSSTGHQKRNLGLLLGLLALGGGALSLVLGSSTDSLQHDTTVEKVLEAGSAAERKVLNVEGTLVHGTLMKRDEPCEYRFRLRSNDLNQRGDLEVRYPACIVPDNFRDVAGMDVIVSARGRIKDGILTADHISTKCPTKYEMQQQQKLGVETPHAEGKQILGFDGQN